jgi:mono/diheme cytochrome c family protein
MNFSLNSLSPSSLTAHRSALLGPVLTACVLTTLVTVFATTGCQSPRERSTVERGRAAFGRICSGCHGYDGKGGARIGFTVAPRDLTDPAFHAGITDEQILFTLRNGKGQMPAFAALLPDSEQLELLAFVRSLSGKAR